MTILTFICAFVAFFTAVSAITSFIAVSARRDVAKLRRQLSELESGNTIDKKQATPATPTPPVAHLKSAPSPQPLTQNRAAQKTAPKPSSGVSWEQRIATRLPVWVGGIALIFAAVFLVKYSIDNNLLSPEVRVIIGGLFGAGLLAIADWLHVRFSRSPRDAGQRRIPQSLFGAGIATLYISAYAATTLYNLLPFTVGFGVMTLITALAVVLSLRHGAPIAILGLVGGFLSPVFLRSDVPNAALLFTYLTLLYGAAVMLARRQGWWRINLLALGGSIIWPLIWIMSGSYVPYIGDMDFLALGLFALAIPMITVAGSKAWPTAETRQTLPHKHPVQILNYTSMGFGIALMAILSNWSVFNLTGAAFFNLWALFGLMSLASIALAFFEQRTYAFAPILCLAAGLYMLQVSPVGPQTPTPTDFIVIAISAALLFIGGTYTLLWRTPNRMLWGRLCAASSFGLYGIAYLQLESSPFIELPAHFWGGLALAIAAAATYACQAVYQKIPATKDQAPQRDRLTVLFSATATAFLSLTLLIELPREFLSVAFALQLLALTWINYKIPLPYMRLIITAVAAGFVIVLAPQILIMLQVSLHSLLGITVSPDDMVRTAKRFYDHGIDIQKLAIVNWPLFQLGLPAVFFAGANYLLHNQKPGPLTRGLEVGVITLLATMAYYLMRHAYYSGPEILLRTASFTERGLTTNGLFIYGLICAGLGPMLSRSTVYKAGLVICGLALFRIGYFDLLIKNPLWEKENVGTLAVLNSLWLPFGFPVLGILLLKYLAELPPKSIFGKTLNLAQLILSFTLVTLLVRQAFHGEFLDRGSTSNAELYSYSAAWLVMGIALLLSGIKTGSRLLRHASLVLMLLTAGKVFLIDASELEGLYRVISFFGLGLSLIGLSYFYSRFVFSSSEEKTRGAP